MTFSDLLEPLHRWCFGYMRAVGMVLPCSDSPNYDGINEAAKANAEIAKQALAWYQQAYADQAPAREKAAETANRVALSQLNAMDTATGMAREADQYNRSTFRPLEQRIVSDAVNFDTEAEREKRAGQSAADVASAFGGARDQLMRDVGRYGIDVSDGVATAGLKDLAAKEALATAMGKNKARQDSMSLGRAMRMDAASLGRNLPGQQATQQQIALSAGNSSVGNAQVPVNLAQSATSMAGQGYNTAISANTSSGNLYANAASIDQKANDSSGMLNGLANLGMAGKYIFSDKNMKKNRKPVSGKVALSQARRMPVEKWKYKEGSAADDGGRTHVGPMAQAVNKAAGEKAAPGGKAIDLVTMNGVTLAALQQIDRNQTKLEKKVVSLSAALRAKKVA